jgi:hypothetical protein
VESSIWAIISIIYKKRSWSLPKHLTAAPIPLEVWLTCGTAVLGALPLRLATHLETDRSQQSRGRNCPSKQLPLLASRSDLVRSMQEVIVTPGVLHLLRLLWP